MRRTHLVTLTIFLTSLFLASCSSYHYRINTQATGYDKSTGYRFDNLKHDNNSDELFICLAFSGGGTRAAAFSYGVLEELKRTPITVDGKQKSLLDEVDCISGISGGSFTAAYYGVFRQQIFEDYREKFLDENIQQKLKGRVLYSPRNWIRLMSDKFDRIDLAAELYDEDIFSRKSIGDMAARGRPYILINATNLESGTQFSFTQDYFDVLGSTLADYPIGIAVAASSAFPILLSPISLMNYSVTAEYQTPGWYDQALETPDVDRYRYSAGKNFRYYLDNEEHKYIHLMDGGLSDNIGVRRLIDEYRRGFIRQRIGVKKINKLVFIVVNAKTAPEETYSQEETRPNLSAVAYKTATISMDNYSYETITLLAKSLNERLQAQKNLQACQKRLDRSCPSAPAIPKLGRDIDPYLIELNFENIRNMEGEDKNYYLNLPTSFSLSKDQVDRLIGIAPKLLKGSEQYQCLLEVLAAEAEGNPRPELCEPGAGIAGKNKD